MRFVYYGLLAAFCIAIFTSRGHGAEPPKFTVENKIGAAPPAFVVVNRLAAPKHDYKGDLPPHPAPASQEWKRYPGESWKLFPLTQPVQAAPEVAIPKGNTFQSGQYEPSHTCPICGRSEYRQSGRGPVSGSHTHTCPAGHAWWHYDK